MIKRSILLSVSLALVSIFTAQASSTQKKTAARKETSTANSRKKTPISAFAVACYTGVVTPPFQTSAAPAEASRASTQKCTQFLAYFGNKTNALCFDLDKLPGAKETAEKPAQFALCSGHSNCWVSYTQKPKTKPVSRLQAILNEQLQDTVHG
jgi:hypothetical protein